MTVWIETLSETFVLGIKNLLRNKLRSFLTMLGMIFGVGSVISMLSVGAGARYEILSRIQELGVRNIIVNSVKPPVETKPSTEERYVLRYGLSFKDAEHIRKTCPTVERTFPVNLVRELVWYGSKRLDCSVLGVQPEHLPMFRLRVACGRTFTQLDSSTEAKVCIVRKKLIEELESIDDPLGMTLRIGSYPFRVVGILKNEVFTSHTRKALALDDRTLDIYIPYTTSMRTFGTMTSIERAGASEHSEVELDQLIVQVKSTEKVFPTSRMIGSILKHSHKNKDYEIIIPLELLQQSEKTQQVFNIVMVLIAGISLLVGGIGIVNIMLATITERTKEIGIRRALGARKVDIIVQFLLETMAIAVIGGLFGCLFGILGILGILHFTQWRAIIAPEYVGISLLISCSVGILFGIFPARRAAQMDPIAALRYE